MSSTLLPDLATRHHRDGGITDSEADTSGGVSEKCQDGREVGADTEHKEVDTSDTLKGEDGDDDGDLCTLSLTEVSPQNSTLIQADDLGEVHDWKDIKDPTAVGGPRDNIGNKGAQDIGATGARDTDGREAVAVDVVQDSNRDKNGQDVLLVHKKAEATFHDTEFDSTQPLCDVPDKVHHHTPTSSTPLPPEVTRPPFDTGDSSGVTLGLPLFQESAIQRPPVPPQASSTIQYSREDICQVVREEMRPILQVRFILLSFNVEI